MSQKVIKKLASIFANQQKILTKLAQVAVFQEEPTEMLNKSEEPGFIPLGDRIRARIKAEQEAKEKAALEEGLPENFDDVLENHNSHKNRWDFPQTLNQLRDLANGQDPDNIMKYYPDWEPHHFIKLLEKLK